MNRSPQHFQVSRVEELIVGLSRQALVAFRPLGVISYSPAPQQKFFAFEIFEPLVYAVCHDKQTRNRRETDAQQTLCRRHETELDNTSSRGQLWSCYIAGQKDDIYIYIYIYIYIDNTLLHIT